MKSLFQILGGCALLLGLQAMSAANVVVVEGNSRATVVIPARPSPGEQLAATELMAYVQRITGVALPIVATDAPQPAPAIVIARHPAPELGREGYALRLRDGRVLVTGARDRSVLYATYDLLERLGCRWLAPRFAFYGSDAEVVPTNSTLRISLSADVVTQPAFALRKLYVEEGLSHDAVNLPHLVDWMTKSRTNVLVVPTDYQGHDRVKWDRWRTALTPLLQQRDLDIEVGGHGYQNFLNAAMDGGRLYQEHPEWFGVADGQRSSSPTRVFCTSNADAVRFLTTNVVRYLAERPEITIFDFWPPDGARWCECAACTKLGPPEDRQARLVAAVLPAVRARGITARFECIAYATAINPPRQPVLDPAVLVDFCPINQCFEAQIDSPESEANARYVAQFQAWRRDFTGELSIYSYYRKYAWRSLPVLLPHYMQRDLLWYRLAGAQGISSYCEPGDWRTYELNHYTLARLAWDPAADVDRLVADFATLRFGVHASAAREVYAALEDTVRRTANIPGTTLKSPAELTAATQRLEAARRGLLDVVGSDHRAGAALASAVDYACHDLALQRMRAEHRDDAAITARAKELVAFYEQHRGEGVFLDRKDPSRLVQAYLPAESHRKNRE